MPSQTQQQIEDATNLFLGTFDAWSLALKRGDDTSLLDLLQRAFDPDMRGRLLEVINARRKEMDDERRAALAKGTRT
jgi:hypothetical protein